MTLLFLLLSLGCNKKTPSGAEDTFTLYVSNLTSESYAIYVSYNGYSEFAGIAIADSLVKLADFIENENTCFEAKQGDMVLYSRCENTIHLEAFTWYLHPQ